MPTPPPETLLDISWLQPLSVTQITLLGLGFLLCSGANLFVIYSYHKRNGFSWRSVLDSSFCTYSVKEKGLVLGPSIAFGAFVLMTFAGMTTEHHGVVSIENDARLPAVRAGSSVAEHRASIETLLTVTVSEIRSEGWPCDSVSGLEILTQDHSFSVECNRSSYAYRALGNDGHWTISRKR